MIWRSVGLRIAVSGMPWTCIGPLCFALPVLVPELRTLLAANT